MDQGYIRVEEAQSDTDCMVGKSDADEQQNPGNQAKYETANRTIEKPEIFLN